MVDVLMTPETLVYLAGVFYILGLLIINQVILRLMVLTGTGFYSLYYATVADTPLWEAMFISILIGCANIYGLAVLLAGRSRLAIPRKHADIFDHFGDMKPGDFRTLMRHANRYFVEEDKILTQEGLPLDRLYYVISGQTYINKKGDCFNVPEGVFVGEVAFLTGSPASATTTLAAGSEVLEWTNSNLTAASERSVRFKLALESVLSLDLARKVAHSVAPNSAVWRPNLANTIRQEPLPEPVPGSRAPRTNAPPN